MEKHERLQQARERAGFRFASDAARAMGVALPTYLNHEGGDRDFRKNVEIYAKKFKVSVSWLMFGSENGPASKTVESVSQLPVRGEVRAGAWYEIDNDEYQSPEYIPAMSDPRYPADAQYALKVVGNSMDRVVQAGQYVIVVDWSVTGKELENKELVVVRRQRDNTFEATLKRALLGEKGWELWPESNDQKHQEKIVLGDGERDVEVAVMAKVLGRYERLA